MRELRRYLVVGLCNTLTGLTIIFACKFFLGLPDAAANAAGYSVGVAQSFALNRQWTFRHTGPQSTAFLRFLGVLAVAYLANLAAVLLLVDRFGTNAYLAHVVGVVPYTVIGFLGARHIAFPRAPRRLRRNAEQRAGSAGR